ncbi:BnaC03g15980D [Brassica napus]|uniref:(rape) hypothetical protein n=1 Tax=Brassica napus TaxID=3708 RepID=A0A078H1V7_BRANA|nr:unnamed protein product [Brassica napus]CDY32630.1 BnaC03g15980D [Brassica napus]
MASSTSLALRRLISSSVVPRSVRPAASLRLFNTNAARSYEEGDNRNHRPNRTVSPRGGDFFSDMFTPTRSLSQVLNFMDQIGESPLLASSGARRGWDLALEQNTLVIKGEGKTEEGDEDDGRKFSSRIGLPEKVYKTDEIKAEMKNGVLKVVVPKLKEDERYNVRHIQVD